MAKYRIFKVAANSREESPALIAILKHESGGRGAFYVHSHNAVLSKLSCELIADSSMRVTPDILQCMTSVDQLPVLSAEDLTRQLATAAGPHCDYHFALREHLAATGHDDKELVELENAMSRILHEQKDYSPKGLFSHDSMMGLKEKCDSVERLFTELFVKLKKDVFER